MDRSGIRNSPRSARRLWQRAGSLLYFRTSPDTERGMRLALRAARAECADTQAAQGRWLLLRLHGYEEDLAQSRYWLDTAARRGSRAAASLRRL